METFIDTKEAFESKKRKRQNTFVPVDELVFSGDNKNNVYRAASLRKKKHDPTR